MRLLRQLALLLIASPALAAPAPDLSGIMASPRPGARIPADALPGLADALGGPPVVLALAYYTCPNLCGVTLGGIAAALKETGLRAGSDFRLIALSIDPAEGPAEATAARVQAAVRLGSNEGLGFLTGDEPEVRRVAEAVGFLYRWDAELKQFLHPVGVFVLAPDGRVSRWISGAGFDGTSLRLALTEAGGGTVGTLTDQLRLLCYHYDPVRGTYDAIVLTALRVAGVLTALGLGGGIAWALRRERRRP